MDVVGTQRHALRPHPDLKRFSGIYALAFSAPALYRAAAALAKTAGCDKTTQLSIAYLVFGLTGVLLWWLTARSPLAPSLQTISAPTRHNLPPSLCNPLIIITAISATIATSIIIGPFGKDADILDDTYSLTYRIILAIGAAFIVPITEELGGRWLLYRGLRPATTNQQTGLSRLATATPAIVISGAAFGLFRYMVAGPARMATTAIIGIILAVAYEWSANLAVPIVAHAFINAQARLTVELGPTGQIIGIAIVAAIALPAFVTLLATHPSRPQT